MHTPFSSGSLVAEWRHTALCPQKPAAGFERDARRRNISSSITRCTTYIGTIAQCVAHTIGTALPKVSLPMTDGMRESCSLGGSAVPTGVSAQVPLYLTPPWRLCTLRQTPYRDPIPSATRRRAWIFRRPPQALQEMMRNLHYLEALGSPSPYRMAIDRECIFSCPPRCVKESGKVPMSDAVSL